MIQFFKRSLALFLVVASTGTTFGFALLGPYEDWQTDDMTYNVAGDIAGPQNLGEEYRWNVPNLYYAFDSSFMDYFGARGVQAVEQAVGILNALPAFSSMSSSLSEYPLQVQRINYRAEALGLLDLKSIALQLLLEELGLAQAERYVWALRYRFLPDGAECPFYRVGVIKRNFDPITWEPSSYVNGTLYSYQILTSCDPVDRSDAVEFNVDPSAPAFTSVTDVSGIKVGGFYTGLTRDDVGGLRYLYRKSNYNIEDLGPTVNLSSTLPPYFPINSFPFLTNAVGGIPQTAFRPGVDKISFSRVIFDPVLGTNNSRFPFTNTYNVNIQTNGVSAVQRVERIIYQPDILFSAADLVVNGPPVAINIASRTVPAFDTSNHAPELNGPGTLEANFPAAAPAYSGIQITFQKVGPLLLDTGVGSEANATPFFVWGSFDGSTKEPVVYPSGRSIREIESIVLGF